MPSDLHTRRLSRTVSQRSRYSREIERERERERKREKKGERKVETPQIPALPPGSDITISTERDTHRQRGGASPCFVVVNVGCE